MQDFPHFVRLPQGPPLHSLFPQFWLLLQSIPQPPQFWWSVSGLMQVSPHSSKSGRHSHSSVSSLHSSSTGSQASPQATGIVVVPGPVVLVLVLSVVTPVELLVVPEVVGIALVIETALVSLVVAPFVVAPFVVRVVTEVEVELVPLPVTGPAVVALVAGLVVAVVEDDDCVMEVSASLSPKPGVGSRHALAKPSARRALSDTTRTLECMGPGYRSPDHICLYNHFLFAHAAGQFLDDRVTNLRSRAVETMMSFRLRTISPTILTLMLAFGCGDSSSETSNVSDSENVTTSAGPATTAQATDSARQSGGESDSNSMTAGMTMGDSETGTTSAGTGTGTNAPVPFRGDGAVDPGEEFDDGNQEGADDRCWCTRSSCMTARSASRKPSRPFAANNLPIKSYRSPRAQRS